MGISYHDDPDDYSRIQLSRQLSAGEVVALRAKSLEICMEWNQATKCGRETR